MLVLSTLLVQNGHLKNQLKFVLEEIAEIAVNLHNLCVVNSIPTTLKDTATLFLQLK
jgi:hypothetical protein